MTTTKANAPDSLAKQIFHLSVIVGALGYFVDIYDLLLFGIVRVPSLVSLGIPPSELLSRGVMLLNTQMAGLFLGGLLWGTLGDKRGRRTVLFGSIILYSTANILNAMVTTVGQYAALRFIAGLGLAGELGAAVTLVTESLHVSKRGYGTALVSGLGILGAVFAGTVAKLTSWRTAYVIGGLLGLGLLILRVSVAESGMFESLKEKAKGIKRGDLILLFSSPDRVRRYLACVLVGVPIWCVIGILVTFAPEFANELGVQGAVTAAAAIASCYAATSVGGLVAGGLSQYWMSRKRAIFAFLAVSALLVPVFLEARGVTAVTLYWICAALGFGAGYWSVFVTTAAEQFGTNLRATAATTIPNFVRGSVIPVTWTFQLLRAHYGLRGAAAIVTVVVFVVGFWAATRLEESSGRNLDFVEV